MPVWFLMCSPQKLNTSLWQSKRSWQKPKAKLMTGYPESSSLLTFWSATFYICITNILYMGLLIGFGEEGSASGTSVLSVSLSGSFSFMFLAKWTFRPHISLEVLTVCQLSIVTICFIKSFADSTVGRAESCSKWQEQVFSWIQVQKHFSLCVIFCTGVLRS